MTITVPSRTQVADKKKGEETSLRGSRVGVTKEHQGRSRAKKPVKKGRRSLSQLRGGIGVRSP